MKASVRYVWAVVAFAGALIVGGCAAVSAGSRGAPPKPAGSINDFTVIESSATRELSPGEMAQLREAVAQYLESEGMMGRRGEYQVRVDFAPEKPGGPGEWVIVKLTNLPAPGDTLVATYSITGPDDYYAYNYPYGYEGAAYGYYEPPLIYPPGYHQRPHRMTPHRPDNHRPGDGRRGDKDNHPRGPQVDSDGRHDRHDGGPRYDHRSGNRRGTPPSSATGNLREHRSKDHSPPPPDPKGTRGHGPRDYGTSPPREKSDSPSYLPPPPSQVSGPSLQTAPENSGHRLSRKPQN